MLTRRRFLGLLGVGVAGAGDGITMLVDEGGREIDRQEDTTCMTPTQ